MARAYFIRSLPRCGRCFKNSATLIPSAPGRCLKTLRRLLHSYHAKKWPMLFHDDGNFRSTSCQHPRLITECYCCYKALCLLSTTTKSCRHTKEPTKFEPTSKISSMPWHSQDPPRFLFFFHGPIQTHLHSIILQTHVEDEFPQAAAAEQNTLSRQDTGCMLGHVFLTDENLQIGTSPFKWCSYRCKRWSAPLTRRPYWFSQKRN